MQHVSTAKEEQGDGVIMYLSLAQTTSCARGLRAAIGGLCVALYVCLCFRAESGADLGRCMQ